MWQHLDAVKGFKIFFWIVVVHIKLSDDLIEDINMAKTNKLVGSNKDLSKLQKPSSLKASNLDELNEKFTYR